MVEPFRVHITALGHGYLAENSSLAISAGGSSPAEAAERARQMGADLIAHHLHQPVPPTLMARIDSADHVAFVMRPFEKRFDLSNSDGETMYIDSLGRSETAWSRRNKGATA